MAKNLKQSLDNSLQHIRLSEHQHRQILQEIVEEGKMKRKLFVSIALMALCIVLGMGMVYALFHSQITALIQNLYGKERLHELEYGKLAKIEEEYSIDDVKFYVSEAIVKEGKVFLSVEVSTEKNFYLLPEGEEKPEGDTPVYSCDMHLKAIGVEDDNLVPIRDYGILPEKINDKHWVIVYELGVGESLPEAESILLDSSISLRALYPKQGESRSKDLLLRIQPTVEVPKLVETTSSPAKIEEDDYLILSLAEYDEKQSLPIYKAVKQDFRKILITELFNQSKVIERTKDSIAFADEAHLNFNQEYIYYYDEDGMFDYPQGDSGTSYYRGPKESVASQLATLVFFETSRMEEEGIYNEDLNQEPLVFLEKEKLTYISLKEAKDIAENLIQAHGLREYELTFAYDLHMERIQKLGEKIMQARETGQYSTNGPMEFLEATAEDEGYYLEYKRHAMENVSTRDYAVRLYITKNGIVHANIHESHQKGEEIRQSGKLMDAKQVVESLPKVLVANGYDIDSLKIVGVRLCYQTKLEKKALIFTPIWQIFYKEDSAQSYNAWANFDAIDGKLLDAIFK